MELEGEYIVPADRELVWAALTDAQMLRACIPSCERVTAVGTNAWEITLSLARGSVHSRFRGRLMTTEVNAPQGGIFVFDGDGGAAGALRGTARLTLEATSAQDTRLIYAAELQLGGRLQRVDAAQVATVVAGIVQRLIDVLECSAPPLLAGMDTASVQTRLRLPRTSARVMSGLRRLFKRR